MQNFLIFLGIIAVGYLAVIDTMDRFKELDRIAVSTPAQMRMKPELNTTKSKGVMQQLEDDANKPLGSNMTKRRTDNIKDQTQTTRKGVEKKYHHISPQSNTNN